MPKIRYVETNAYKYGVEGLDDLEVMVTCDGCSMISRIFGRYIVMKGSRPEDAYVRCTKCFEELNAYKVISLLPQKMFQEILERNCVPTDETGVMKPVSQMTDQELLAAYHAVSAEMEQRFYKKLQKEAEEVEEVSG